MTSSATADDRLEVRDTSTPWTLRTYPTRAGWEERARFIREHILACTGLWPLPPKTPLKPRIFGRIERDGYAVEKVFFESLPGFFVCGNLYRPLSNLSSGSGRSPAIASPHGHWSRGRLEDSEMCSVPGRCINLARQGNVVFSWDMAGYRDSNQVDHREFGGLREDLWGTGVLGLQLWNSIRVIDFLAGLPDVDAKRIGCTGASGGGSQAFLLGAVDDRVAASVPVNMVSSSMQGGCNCENQAHLRLEINNVEIAAAMAPRPLLLVSTTGDWTANTVEIEHPAIRAIYRLYGAENRLSVHRVRAAHNYNRESRQAVYGFFSRWLHDGDRRVAESPFQTEADEDLLVFGKGRERPRKALDGSGVAHLLRARSEKRLSHLKPVDRGSLRRLKREMGVALRHALSSQTPTAEQLFTRNIGTERGPQWLTEELVIGRKEQGERIPAALLSPLPYAARGPAVLVVHPRGKAALLADASGRPGPLVRDLLSRGHRVLTIDPFLTGESYRESGSPESGPSECGSLYDPESVGHFHTYNKSVAACRIQDILTALTYLDSRDDVGRRSLLGLGAAGIYCLLARSLAAGVHRTCVDLSGFDASSDQCWLERCFVPAIRAAGDVRTAMALFAPGHLLIHGVGDGFPSAWAQAAYRAAGNPERLCRFRQRQTRQNQLEWITLGYGSHWDNGKSEGG